MTPRAYYNENDKFAAAWLRELIARDLIAPGDVDERSIVDVRPSDLSGYGQCHFFAGIAGWSYALRLAGWADDREVWTGSCPCQPFSSAGSNAGGADSRHLWPTWFRLIQECRPHVVFGEQVEAAIAHGWIDLVCDDLEKEGYACGSVGLPCPSVGGYHLRSRLWWVADSESSNRRLSIRQGRSREEGIESVRRSETGGMDDAMRGRQPRRVQCDSDVTTGQRIEAPERSALQPSTEGRRSLSGFWADAEWISCADGRQRPVEPGTFPLAHGLPARVGRLRGYGNAIVPQVAAAFIAAYMDITEGAAA